jgi:pimeloyl-ACP methyl ester carboxylesterase
LSSDSASSTHNCSNVDGTSFGRFLGVMGERIEINGHPTWVDQRGDGGDTIVLLHGGMSNSDTLLDVLCAPLLERHRLVAFDRRGHGFTADTDAPFHYDDMATETIGVLEKVVNGPANLVGWSDGGIVGLLVALRRPDLVDRLVLIGVNFHFEGVLPLELDPSSPVAAMMVQSYADRSPDGEEHFGDVFGKFLTMMATEPMLTVDDLVNVTAPTLVMVGDDDLMVLNHTCALYEALPAGQLCVVPRASHGLPLEYPDETARQVLNFLAADLPPDTLMPTRRVTPR